jgi:hypothetical protein
MIRHLFVLALTLAVLPAVALPKEAAHKATWALPNSSVLVEFCREMQNQGDYAIADCLKANSRRLSSACRRVIEAGSR